MSYHIDFILFHSHETEAYSGMTRIWYTTLSLQEPFTSSYFKSKICLHDLIFMRQLPSIYSQDFAFVIDHLFSYSSYNLKQWAIVALRLFMSMYTQIRNPNFHNVM